MGEIFLFASVMRTRGCILCSSHELGRVSYNGAAGFEAGLEWAQRGAVVNDVYFIGLRMHELTRVS